MNADVTRIVSPVDERRAAGFFDAGELGKRNLLSAGSGNKKVPNLARAGTELRLHANDEVEEFFSLDDLRGSLSVGDDGLFHNDRYKWSLRLTAVNLTNKTAIYNFLSTFSGTHFVTPRAFTAELGFHF